MRTLGEEMFADRWTESDDGRIVPNLQDAMYAISYGGGEVRQRLQTRTPPIKAETPAWKVIRAAWLQFDFEQRHAGETGNVTAK